MTEYDNKLQYQSELLSNRLQKRYKHLKKWAKRSNVTCYRLYDKDIPEIPLAIDLFNVDFCESDKTIVAGTQFVQVALYNRPYEKSETDEEQWLCAMCNSISNAINIPRTSILTKVRKQQKGDSQYEKINNQKLEFIVTENLHRFKVNLSDYIDTGLFFDHRPLRQKVEQTSFQKNVLNLFCYTGSFSVYAAAGKACSVTSVDLSNTYLAWAKQNMALNGFLENENYKFIASDVKTFLENQIQQKKQQYDIIILDPPTFSNSKKTSGTLDINRDWSELVGLCTALLSTNGVLYFSTNSKKLKFDDSLLPKNFIATDITSSTIPEDFRNEKIHRVWEISKVKQY